MENVKMDVKKNNQANQQNNQQANQQNSQDLQKTVVNGKVVSLKQAQQIEEQFNQQQAQQTGIQAHHNNDSESVPAGQVAQNQNMMQQAEQQAMINQTNLQSGQSHLSGMEGAGMTHEQKMQQADHDSVQNSVDVNNNNAKGTSKAKTKKED
jgi:hypothetical protein